ncbi:MAG: hypothetical protein DRR08_20005 [Candidatus Parabeggiatoa sp. nov. 2]|nr:MAG: hypothetical protein B6247_13255 [Beggiatoa sp. 4572_84]RKZ57072.1 MAG: hypothetical protein DRR08_20005 [Gammaproteobacteria bacterium]HEC85910.1 hypothetical protein [Thioploca sp.]
MKTKLKTKQELFDSIETAIKMGNYIFTEPAEMKAKQRQNVTDLQVINLLKSQAKNHEAERDYYVERYADWNYHITGKTINHEKVRIVVFFDSNLMHIITVINLNDDGKGSVLPDKEQHCSLNTVH